VDYPEQNDKDWFCHVQLKMDENGNMACHTRPVDEYVVALDEEEKDAYSRLRVKAVANA
jgi:hypothetical protein